LSQIACGERESFGELWAVIHTNVGGRISIEELKEKVAMTNTKHAANTGIGAMEIKRFWESNIVA
jgi:hypothetical protein